MIGSPVTWAQAAQALTFDLAVDPIAIARYVSFDIPTDAGATTNLALAEVKVEEITESGSGDMVLEGELCSELLELFRFRPAVDIRRNRNSSRSMQ